MLVLKFVSSPINSAGGNLGFGAPQVFSFFLNLNIQISRTFLSLYIKYDVKSVHYLQACDMSYTR